MNPFKHNRTFKTLYVAILALGVGTVYIGGSPLEFVYLYLALVGVWYAGAQAQLVKECLEGWDNCIALNNDYDEICHELLEDNVRLINENVV